MAMGPSIFFDNIRILPANFGPLNILIWIFIAWLFICVGLPGENRLSIKGNSVFGKRLVFPDELFIIAVVIIWYINLGIAYATTYPFSFQTVTFFCSIFIGYLLLRGIFANVDRQEIIQFIEAIIIVNAIACILYILHSGLHLPIYLEQNYQEATFEGAIIIRTFSVAPKFNELAVAFFMCKSKWNVKTISILFFTLLSMFFTYTRSLMIGIIILIVASQFLLAIRYSHNIKRVFITFLILFIVTGSTYFILNKYYPQSIHFFTQRFEQASSIDILEQNNSLSVRLNSLKSTYQMIEKVNPAIGIGFIDKANSPRLSQATYFTADNDYAGIIYRFGIIGLICFICFYVFAAWRGLGTYLSSNENGTTWFWLVCFLWICFFIYNGMFEWNVLQPSLYPIALWMFALIEARFVQEKIPANL